MRSFMKRGVLVLGVALSATAVFGQFEPPEGALPMEDTGTIEQIASGMLRIRDSKNELWLLQMTDDTYVSVEAEAKPNYLKAGMLVQFWAAIDRRGAMEDPLEEIQVLPKGVKATLGLFDENETALDAKPLRNPGEGYYMIRGKLATFRNGQLAVTAGTQKVNGTVDEQASVWVSFEDLDMAGEGDTVHIKAWYFEIGKPVAAMNRPGQAMVEEIVVTLSEPLGGKPVARRQAFDDDEF